MYLFLCRLCVALLACFPLLSLVLLRFKLKSKILSVFPIHWDTQGVTSVIPEDNFYNMSLAISVTTTMFALLGITLDRKLGRATFWLLMINSSVSAVASAMWISSAFAVLWIDDVYQAKLGLGVLTVPASFFYGMLPAFTWLKFVSAQKSCADGKKREIRKQS